MKKSDYTQDNFMEKYIVPALIGTVTVLFLSLVLSFIFHYFYVPEKIINIISALLKPLALVICGFFTGRRSLKNGLLKGALSGISLSLFFTLSGVLLFNIHLESEPVLKALLYGVLLGGTAGVIGINSHKKA